MWNEMSLTYRPLEYERVYLPLYNVADTPFHIQEGDALKCQDLQMFGHKLNRYD